MFVLRFSVPSFVMIFMISSQASASPEQMAHDFGVLKSKSSNYEVFGTVCEEVSRLRFEEEYPSEVYDVKRSVEYRDRDKVLGELDVVVFEKKTREAVVVAEVKCWNDFGKALAKAHAQLTRFESAIDDRVVRDIYLKDEGSEHYTVSQFDAHPLKLTVAYEGGQEAGFDRDIGLTMDEVKRLRTMLMEHHGRSYNEDKKPSRPGRGKKHGRYRVKLFKTLENTFE